MDGRMTMRSMTKLFLLLMAVFSTGGNVVIYNEDPYSSIINQPDFQPDPEPYTNKSMDQLITESLGGLQGYIQDHFMAEDGTMIAELDMRLTSDQFGLFYSNFQPPISRKKRKATRPERYRWTNGEIPYEFVSSHFSASEVYTIKQALQEWMDTTCLRFRPARHGDTNRIRFQNGAGCNSALGMVGGTQVINLQTPGCRYKGLYLHEVGHALGLVHEHQLPDRDQYIVILYNNVSPSMRIWFNKYTTQQVNQYGVPYEYSSVMHYGITAFSQDGRSQTIRAKDRSREREIGNVWAKGLSFSDIKVVNLMYNCNANCTADPSCNSPGYLDKNCRCVCPRHLDCSGGTGTGTTTTTSTTGGGGGGGGTCTNGWGDSQCNPWAARGECTANPVWMMENCRKACGGCGSTTTARTTTYMPSPPPDSTTTQPPTSPSPTTTTTTGEPTSPPPDTTTRSGQSTTTAAPTPPPETTTTTTASTATTTYMPSPPPSSTHPPTTTTRRPTTCVNRWGDRQCVPWARNGECSRNSVLMRTNCAKACGVCTGSNCRDTDGNCQYWYWQGYCGRSQYMNQHCRRSCGLCGRGVTRSRTDGGNCQDTNQNCAAWRNSGYCNSAYYTMFMRTQCRASCNLC